jgi:hypothetical protein
MTDRPVAQIRVATPDDAPALAVMHVDSWRETYAGILPDKILSSLSIDGHVAATSETQSVRSSPDNTSARAGSANGWTGEWQHRSLHGGQKAHRCP